MADAGVPAIVIAAGGAGRRLSGNKPARLLGGRSLLDRAADWARRHSDCVALAGAGEGGAAQTLPDVGLPVLGDARPGLGPIAALASSFGFARAHGCRQVLLIGCDMPFLPDDLVPRLQAAIAPAGAALPCSNGRLHPLAGLWHPDPAGLAAWIDAGGRAPRHYAAAVGLATVDWGAGSDDPFANINGPEDLARAERRLTQT